MILFFKNFSYRDEFSRHDERCDDHKIRLSPETQLQMVED
jgi:hypothetical protein